MFYTLHKKHHANAIVLFITYMYTSVYKACMNHFPAYVSSIDTLRTACSSVKDRCFLRSASAGKYIIPGACLFFGQQPFYCHWLLHLEFPTPQVCIFSLRLSFDLKSKLTYSTVRVDFKDCPASICSSEL